MRRRRVLPGAEKEGFTWCGEGGSYLVRRRRVLPGAEKEGLTWCGEGGSYLVRRRRVLPGAEKEGLAKGVVAGLVLSLPWYLVCDRMSWGGVSDILEPWTPS